MAYRTLSDRSRTVERLRRRADRLLTQHQLYIRARDACRQCHHATKIRPASVRIRGSFIISRGISSDVDPTSQWFLSLEGRAFQETTGIESSPAGSLVAPKGIALQIYLIALFEAQCRVGIGVSPHNDRPIISSGRRTVGWLDLIASETAAAKPPTTKRDNLLRQFKRGLGHLERERLVVLSGAPRSNGRFEAFRLLDESGSLSKAGSEVPYSTPKDPYLDVPRAVRLASDMIGLGSEQFSSDPVIAIPADFFLNGWVHVLSPAELVTYLMLRDLCRRHGTNRGVFICGKPREQFYGLRRDVYESHRLLSLYGLIEKVENKNRRRNGTVRSFKTEDNPLEPHRFRLLPDALKRDAFSTVTQALRDPASFIVANTFDELDFIRRLRSAMRENSSMTEDQNIELHAAVHKSARFLPPSHRHVRSLGPGLRRPLGARSTGSVR